MNWLETIWKLLNTPAAITAIASILLYGLNRLYGAKPLWQRWEGAIITAVKLAEKAIPDELGANSGLAKLDVALKAVLEVYEHTTGKAASSKVEASLKEGIQILHAELEAAGTLER